MFQLHLKVCEFLCSVGADPNMIVQLNRYRHRYSNYDENTPLHVACELGHLKICELLIKAGANVNATNVNGDTSLHIACRMRRLKICEVLCLTGVDLNIKNRSGDTCYDISSSANIRKITLRTKLCEILDSSRILTKAAK
jgi:ankyrin repeat protein